MAEKPFVSPRRLKRFFTGLLGEKLNTKEEILANTDVKKFAGAMALQEIYEDVNNSLGGIKLGQKDGKYGYFTGEGADTFCPFKSGLDFENYGFIATIGNLGSYEIIADGIYMISYSVGNNNKPSSTGTLLYEDEHVYPNYSGTYSNKFSYFECVAGDTISYAGTNHCNIVRLM